MLIRCAQRVDCCRPVFTLRESRTYLGHGNERGSRHSSSPPLEIRKIFAYTNEHVTDLSTKEEETKANTWLFGSPTTSRRKKYIEAPPRKGTQTPRGVT